MRHASTAPIFALALLLLACAPSSAVDDGPLVCDAPTLACGEECVDGRTDPGNCGACGARCGDAQVCLDGACAPRRYVVTGVTLPGKRTDLSMDLDGDQNVDNRLAEILSVIVSASLAPQAAIDAEVKDGVAPMILDIDTTGIDVCPGGCVRVTVSFALPRPGTGPAPNGPYVIDEAFTPARLYAALGGGAGGRMLTLDPRATKQAATIELPTAWLGAPAGSHAPPITLDGARLELTLSPEGTIGPRRLDVKLRGTVRATLLPERAFPVLAAALSRFVDAEPGDPITGQLRSLFDSGPVCTNPDGSKSTVVDAHIDPCEIPTSPYLAPILAPDIDAYDAAGRWNPNPTGRAKDALSIGVGLQATAVGD